MAEYKKIISYGFKTSMSFTKISIMKDFFSFPYLFPQIQKLEIFYDSMPFEFDLLIFDQY